MGRAARKQRGRGVALVTGASSGIGEAFSHALARDGFDLVLVARRRRRLAALARELSEAHGVASEPFPADLSTTAGLRRVGERIAREPRLELLVNDAGMGEFGRFAGSEWSREESEIRVNVLAVVRLVHAALPRMIRRGRGAVINVSSTAAFVPTPSFAVYGATKAFVNSFTEALHVELRGTGIRVQVLCPGLTHTEIFARVRADMSGVPEFLWMEPAEVVAESLSALERGTVLCVPGLKNRTVANLARMLPHAASSRIAELLTRSVKPARIGVTRPSPT